MKARICLGWLTLGLVAGCGSDASQSFAGNEPSIVVGEGEGSSGSPEPDAGTVDSDAGTSEDAGSNPSLDVGVQPGEDASPADGGGVDPVDVGGNVCAPGTTECEGNILLTCNEDGSAVGRTRCEARSLVCGTGPDGSAACVEPSCTPGESFCSNDLSRSLTCTESGTVGEGTRCDEGCNPETGACFPPASRCPLETFELDANESYTFNLCGAGDDFNHLPGDYDCGEYTNRGPDVLFEFTLARTSQVFLDLQDDDASGAVDTILYLRSSCDEASSQIICSDDVDCDESTVEVGDCTGGVQRRQSRIVETLSPGTYYVVADTIEYGSDAGNFRCGPVLLTYEVEPVDAP